MRPGQAVDEALDEEGGGDGPAWPSAGVLHVGDRAVDLLFIGLGQGQAPQGLLFCLRGREELLGEFVAVRKQAAVVIAERDDDGAGQGGQVDHEARLEAVLTVPNRIRQDEPALSVGVDDLDGLAGHGGDDVAWTLGVAIRHVLDQAEDADRVDLGLAASQDVHHAGDRSSAAHVPLHVLHAVGRLDADASGIEADTLAHESHGLGGGIGRAIPAQDDHLALAHAPLADPEQGPHTQLTHLLLAQDLDRQAQGLQGLNPPCELGRIEDVGRLGDEVAGEDDGVRQGRKSRHGLGGGGGMGRHDLGADDRGLLVGSFPGPVFVETIGAQAETQGRAGCEGTRIYRR